jgi:UDP-N-acetylmuramoyl-L-alanyl-D-glutamate--2,6-diaminopimelate ligase
MDRSLSEMLPPDVVIRGDTSSVRVAGVTADSRAVKPGYVFAALTGTRTDGSKFITQAIASGAVAVLLSAGHEPAVALGVPLLFAPEPRRALAQMAALFYALRADAPHVVAVTGTNGKTSVAEFTRQIFAHLGRQAASLGTIGVVKPDGAVYGSLTTPDPVTLARTLAELTAQGVTHVALEASSHGLDQYRLDGVALTAAAFTNLGRDHLDYHPTVEAYLTAKLRLFSEVLTGDATAVVNADDPRAADVIAIARARGLTCLTVGERGETLRLASLTPDGFAQRMSIVHKGRMFDVALPLVGSYQASNALVAAGLVMATGEPADAVLAALPHIAGVKGRLDIVGGARGGLGVVDYAHKPEALAAALDALRPFASGKLICVFGCGGDRDRGKRPIMGAIAAAKSDVVIVTDDNPRTEIARAIRAEVLAGATGASDIGDRAEAIAAAVAMMGPGDVVLIAGKGHETGQIVGATVLPFSDHDVLARAMREHDQEMREHDQEMREHDQRMREHDQEMREHDRS